MARRTVRRPQRPAAARPPPDAQVDKAVAAHEHALALWRRGEYRRAGLSSDRAVALLERAVGPRHPDLASALNLRASLYLQADQPRIALRLYRRAERIVEHAGDDVDRCVIRAHAGRGAGTALRVLGRYPDAA